MFCEYADLAEIGVRLADMFYILVRLTVTDCCRITTVTVMADKTARLTDVRAKNALLCGYQHPIMDPLEDLGGDQGELNPPQRHPV